MAAAVPGLTVPRRQLSASSVDRGSLKNINIAADLKQLPRGPAPALGLGLGGLIPFVSAPVYMYNAGFFLPAVAAAQLAYAATILSFLGGVRWGALVTAAPGDPDLAPSWAQFSWSVAPSLVAWGALLVPSVAAGQLVCGAGLVAAAMVDVQQRSIPPGSEASASSSPSSPSSPCYENNQDLVGALKKCTKMRPHRQPRGRRGRRRQQT